ncbi:sulfite oxidase-like oxidoreductase [Devosia sp.]|uniref:sulfite oxidase-like oxidoreductase n=1 Tax=Devosia sp. TaxID=1871048 RepID=UPI003F6E7D5C
MSKDDDLPQDSKLTRTKSRWAELGKFLTGQLSRPEEARLPPGQHLVKNWPILDLGQTPTVSRDVWRLDIAGEVERPQTWSFDDLMAQPQADRLSDIHCVTSWSRYDNHWKGVTTHQLMEAVGVKAEARFVLFSSNDGYTTNMAIEDFASEAALLAHSWENEPLTRDHGGPVRLVVPHLYFWKSPKWLKRIEFAARDHRGFWEVRGYHNHADPWKEERYS